MAARANRDFGTGSLSFTFAASDGSCGTAEFRRVAANDEAAVYRFDDARWQMIVFKGSEDSEDWADNILGIFRADCNLEGPCGGVHSGWLDELKERSAMHVNMFMDFRTLITGFSLGGAIATLDGYVHARWGVPEVRIVTFGAPQVGDDDWVAAFGRAGVASYNRYVNVQGGRADPVTNMPGTFVGYRHVGTYREVEQGASHDMTAYERGVAGRDPNCRWGGSDDDGSSKGSSDAAMYAGGGYRSGCPSGPPSYSREAVDRTPYRTCQGGSSPPEPHRL
ncbi:Alpha/Beta hydrolase protein [Hyaloraphidium curvatum]|nr:Alpha/Beta hydrolase protein [Hyaloraphidium curvatum]